MVVSDNHSTELSFTLLKPQYAAILLIAEVSNLSSLSLTLGARLATDISFLLNELLYILSFAILQV